MPGCWLASTVVHALTGWPLVWGDFDPDPFDDTPARLYGHVWNQMPDGRIYDATASQFGLPEPFITDPDNPLYVAAPQEYQVL